MALYAYPQPAALNEVSGNSGELSDRARFEAWAHSIGARTDADEHGNYLSSALNFSKMGWQAALAATGKLQESK
jgi:hypothetical protein